MKETKHMHHILPVRLGGTEDPENLVELTVADLRKPPGASTEEDDEEAKDLATMRRN